MKNANQIRKQLQLAATDLEDVIVNADVGSITLESFRYDDGRITDLEINTDKLEVIDFDDFAPREVVMVEKDVFDQALEDLENLAGAGPDPIIAVRMGELIDQLNRLREALGMRKLVREAPADE